MESQLFFTLSLKEAKAVIRDCINECLQENKPNVPSPDLPRYLTRKEVAKILGLSLPTLDRYNSLGLIQSKRIGNRVLFSDEDIQKALTSGPVKYSRLSQ